MRLHHLKTFKRYAPGDLVKAIDPDCVFFEPSDSPEDKNYHMFASSCRFLVVSISATDLYEYAGQVVITVMYEGKLYITTHADLLEQVNF